MITDAQYKAAKRALAEVHADLQQLNKQAQPMIQKRDRLVEQRNYLHQKFDADIAEYEANH